jgi:glycosyltransferase involved in cell wall biosynthesis
MSPTRILRELKRVQLLLVTRPPLRQPPGEGSCLSTRHWMNPHLPVLSIVIPAFNEEKLLPSCLQHVRQACDASGEFLRGYELIVCDNNSTDRTAAVAEQFGCKVVAEPINQISRARNRGAGIATGGWLLFIDADSWPSPELLADAVPIMRSPDYIGCGSTIRIEDGPWWFKRAWESKNLSMRILKWCPGGFILCRREAFTTLGGFPLDRYIFEEAEFVKRLKQLGAKRRQKFTILHRHPFTASGRKGTQYGFLSWAKTAAKLWLSHRRLIRDKSFADKWYKSGR